MHRNERMAATAQRYIDNEQFSSIEWLVEHRGNEIARGQAGWADAESRQPLGESPIYRLYSMTKPVVSVLALVLIEQGKLRLYDALSQYNPKFARMRVLYPDGRVVPAQRPILVEDLITHRSGFTYEFITGCQVAQYYRAANISSDGQCSLDEMMARLAEQPLADQPGARYRYSVSTDALAHVCERAADRPLPELLDELIFRPLDMTETAYNVPADRRERLLPVYGHTDDLTALPSLDMQPHELKQVDVEQMYPVDHLPNFVRGGHGLFSTMDDYAAFARMLLDGRARDGTPILSQPMLEAMRVNRIPLDQLPITVGMNPLNGYGWGLGVRVMVDRGQASSLTGLGELGWAGAATTYFWVDPGNEMIGLVMSQYLGATQPMTDDMRVAAYQMLV